MEYFTKVLDHGRHDTIVYNANRLAPLTKYINKNLVCAFISIFIVCNVTTSCTRLRPFAASIVSLYVAGNILSQGEWLVGITVIIPLASYFSSAGNVIVDRCITKLDTVQN